MPTWHTAGDVVRLATVQGLAKVGVAGHAAVINGLLPVHKTDLLPFKDFSRLAFLLGAESFTINGVTIQVPLVPVAEAARFTAKIFAMMLAPILLTEEPPSPQTVDACHAACASGGA